MSAYLAVGVWHHWLVRRDLAFVQRFWPSVRAGLDWVVSQQLPFGGINWTPDRGRSRCWPAPRASTSRCAPASRSPSCSTTRSPSGSWPAAGSATPCASTATCSRTSRRYSMDWYYPVLGGAVRGRAAYELLESRWDDVRRARPRHPLRRHQPVGDRRRDLRAGDGARRARRPPARADAARGHAAPARADGRYWTGWVYDDHPDNGEPRDVYWPVEHTTYTAAAVILAVDALGEVAGHSTAGSGIMRGTSLAPHFARARPRVRLPVSRRRLRPLRPYVVAPASSPSASTSSKLPPSSARRKTWYGGCPPSAGSGNTSWITSSAAVHAARAPSRCSRSGRAPRRGRRR